MGCMCCKPSSIEGTRKSPREQLSSKAASNLQGRKVTLSRREGHYHAEAQRYSNNGRGFIKDQGDRSVAIFNGNIERKREKTDYLVAQHLGICHIPKATEGELVAAGWPSWLASVAGEAIKGWVPRRADSFEKLNKVCFFLYLSLSSKFSS